MTQILAALSPSLIVGALVLWLCVRVPLTQPHDRCSPQQPYQQPRRLRVGQSRNHFGDDA